MSEVKQSLKRLCQVSVLNIQIAERGAIGEIEQKILAANDAKNAGNFVANLLRSAIVFGDFKYRKKFASQCEKYLGFQDEIRRIAAEATGDINAIGVRSEEIAMTKIGENRHRVNELKELAVSQIQHMANQKLHWMIR